MGQPCVMGCSEKEKLRACLGRGELLLQPANSRSSIKVRTTDLTPLAAWPGRLGHNHLPSPPTASTSVSPGGVSGLPVSSLLDGFLKAVDVQNFKNRICQQAVGSQ